MTYGDIVRRSAAELAPLYRFARGVSESKP